MAEVDVLVVRKNGTFGDIQISWTTKSDSATESEDYEGGSGQLKFGNSEVCAMYYRTFDILYS